MKFKVITECPVAFDSVDHLEPGGTMHDNSRNPMFNRRLFELMPKKPLVVMDLGCSGGGFVKDMLDEGHFAVGLEGSDYSTKWDFAGGTEQERARRRPGKRAEWATIPDNLFTCDISRPFTVETDPATKFDVITAWEVMEHIPEERLDQLCKNVSNHLTDNGVWLMSVSTQVGPHHVTVHNRSWWLDMFRRNGFVNNDRIVLHFNGEWVRGPRQNAPGSFNLAMQKSC